MNAHDPPGGAITRRRFLVAGGTALLTAAAGCSAVADFVGDQILEDVNVLNQVNRNIKGSVEVTDPAGDTALDETFDVPSNDEDGEGNTATYSDVWEDAGDYEISVELTNTDIEGVSQASETVTINDTGEDMVAIVPNSDETDEPIAIRVGDSLSEFGQTESG